MKPEKVSTLVGKKKTELINPVRLPDGTVKKFVHSWDIHYGVTATLEPGESYEQVLEFLTHDLQRQVNKIFGDETQVKLKLVVNR